MGGGRLGCTEELGEEEEPMGESVLLLVWLALELIIPLQLPVSPPPLSNMPPSLRALSEEVTENHTADPGSQCPSSSSTHRTADGPLRPWSFEFEASLPGKPKSKIDFHLVHD